MLQTLTNRRRIPARISLFALLALAAASTGCSETSAPRIDQVNPDPPHAMEFVHRAKTVYAFTTPSGAGQLYVWWRSITRDGIVDHPGMTIDAAADNGLFDAFLTSCDAIRFFRYPIRASLNHNGQQKYVRLDFEEEILHAGTIRPAHAIAPGRDTVVQQARYFFHSNPLFAGGIGPYIPPATTEADVIMELHIRLER